MTKTKLCGVTNLKDAQYAVGLGYDFLGFVFVKESPRNISSSKAKEITDSVGLLIKTVGVFVNESAQNILNAIKKCRLNLVQLHGEETPEFCSALRQKLPENCHIIKSFHMRDDFTFKQMLKFQDVVDYFLLDSFVEGEYGGTGQTFDWGLAVEAKKFEKPIFLSGGLNAENVDEAIKKVLPFAVDVSSGVERLPRRKDYDKIKDFIKNVKKL